MCSSIYMFMRSYTKNKGIKTYYQYSCQAVRSIIYISQSFSHRNEVAGTSCNSMSKFSFVHTGKVVETCESGHQTCMCGLLICSSYCPAKYADSYEILDNNDNLAPYLGSNWDSIDSMFDFAEITNNSRVLDLGAGDGRVLIRAIQRGAELAVGYELNKSVFELGRNHIDKYYDTTELSKNNDCRNIKIYNEDCRNIKSFNDYNLVTLFLLPEGLRMLEPFLSTHLCDKSEDSSKKKITVVSLGWPIPNWEIKKQTVSRFGTNIFLYYKNSA